MKRLAAILLACVSCWAQEAGTTAPDAKIEVSGRITKVGLAFGQGMPSFELKTPAGRVWKVWLGSMRYLVEQNFNPKTGEEAAVRGVKGAPGQGPAMCCVMSAPSSGAHEVVAFSVTLTQARQTIRLRDDSGMPLWRGRFRGRGGRF